MDELILHDLTKQAISFIKSSNGHAHLLHGENGVGLFTIAQEIAGKGAIVIGRDDESIKIEEIQALHEQARGKNTKTFYIIIDNADKMTRSAQSAFLKLLEEPPSHSKFILTTHNINQLLSTIISRVNVYLVHKPSLELTNQYIDEFDLSDTDKTKLKFMASQRPSLINKYINDQDKFTEDAGFFADAKKYLSDNQSSQSLAIILKYTKSKQSALKFIETCISILEFTIHKSNTPKETLDKLDLLLEIHSSLENNLNLRLSLAKLMI